MFKHMSLKQQIIGITVVLATIPTIACGLFADFLADRSVYNSEVQYEQSIASNISDKVNRFMFERYGDIQAISNLPMLTNPKISAIVNSQEKSKTLGKYLDIYLVYDNIAIYDLNGKVIVQSPGKQVPNRNDSKYIQKVIQAGEAVIDEPTVSPLTGEMVIHFSKAIQDVTTGKPIAVVRSRMPIKALEDLLGGFDKSGYEWSLVTNASGNVFTSSHEENKGKEIKSLMPIFSEMQAENKLATKVGMYETEKLLTYSPFEKLDGLTQLEWSAVVGKDTSLVFAARQQLFWTIAVGSGLAALGASGVAILFADRITNLIKTIANNVATSSTEIAATVEQQERTIVQQATSVHETTTTVEQMGSISRQAAEQAEASATGARQALSLAETGSQAVRETMEGMSILKEQVRAIAEQIMRLSEQTGQIMGVSDLVADLANQTNMLALNAAVEAARAGDSGKGFAVVAGEIRKLADESKKSAEKINNLVTDVQSSMNSTVMVTDEGTKKADFSIQLTQQTAETFMNVADAVNNVYLNSQQISMSSKQQVVGIQQIVAAMNSLNLGAQETTAGINQVKVSTQHLKESATKLQEVI
jgi:hypothetical protein